MAGGADMAVKRPLGGETPCVILSYPRSRGWEGMPREGGGLESVMSESLEDPAWCVGHQNTLVVMR